MDNKKCYLASIGGTTNSIALFIINEKTQKFVEKNLDVSSLSSLFHTLLKYKTNLKLVLMNLTSETKVDYKAAKEIKAFLEHHQIPFHPFSIHFMTAFSIFVSANITPSINDQILVFVYRGNAVELMFYRFTADGHKIQSQIRTEIENWDDAQNTFEKTIKESGVKHIILFSLENDVTLLRNFEKQLRSNKNINAQIFFVDYKKFHETQHSGRYILEISKWFFDRSYIKYYVLSQNLHKLSIMGVTGDSQKKLITVEAGIFLPFAKSIIFNKSVQKCLMIKENDYGVEEVIETLEKVNQNCHQRKLSVTIENECFPEFKVEPIIFPAIENLPKKLDELKLEFPVIGFFRQSSVICVNETNDGYKFLDSWNGLYGNELFITFDQDKPKCGMNEIQTDKTKMSFVVYDLVKILSMPVDEIVVNPNWKFEITKDSDNPVLLEFDNFGGTPRSMAPPAFLMALLLKEHLKMIKNESKNAETPKEIGLCFFDKFADAEMKRIKAGLEEACQLMKVECKFIDL